MEAEELEDEGEDAAAEAEHLEMRRGHDQTEAILPNRRPLQLDAQSRIAGTTVSTSITSVHYRVEIC